MAPDSPAINYSPQTPGIYGSDSFGVQSPYSPAPQRYGASGSGSSSFSSYMQSPRVGFTPGGPAASPYNPQTPGYETGYNPPETPGGGLDLGQADWVTTDIQVRVKRHEDRTLVNLVGHVRSVTGTMCSIFLPEKDRVINIMASCLEPITPNRGDMVKVLMGEDREMCGKMLSVEGRDAVIKQENPDVIKVVPWQFLCRMAPGVRT